MLALAEGWNPLRDPPLPVELRADNIWINHYPKAAWIAQAILLRATGSLEASKGLQLLPLAAAALLLFAARRSRGARAGTAVFLSALGAGTPVALAQAFSFYNDGMGASLTTAMLALTWHWRRRCDPWLLLALAACIVVTVNLKFTGLVYGVLLSAGLVLYARRRGATADRTADFRWFVAAIAGAFAIATLVVGFDPYVTNLLRKGHPFYPLMGQGAVDIITIQLAPEFHALTRPTRFFVGLFARADEHNVAPMLKWPFGLGASELRAVGYPDVRIGGFGPLFGLAVLLAAAIGLCGGGWAWWSRPEPGRWPRGWSASRSAIRRSGGRATFRTSGCCRSGCWRWRCCRRGWRALAAPSRWRSARCSRSTSRWSR